jgi:hypothetical protein
MFSALLEAVESLCPGDLATRVSPDEYQVLVDAALGWLLDDSKPLLGAAQAVLGDDIFEPSEVGFECTAAKPNASGTVAVPVDLACMFIRPGGVNRALSLDLTVLRGYKKHPRLQQASVEIELDFNELSTKAAFESIYRDYKAQTCRLLDQAQLAFFTSYCSDIVGKTKSAKVSAKLDEYFSDPEADCSFTLSKSCPQGTAHSTGIRAFLILCVLYVACRNQADGKAWRTGFEKSLMRLV